MKKTILFFALMVPSFLYSCGTAPDKPKDFDGVTFDSETIEYDGKEHTITAKGVPDFATATYKDNGPFVNVGSYPMSVTVTATGYNSLTLSATLTIKGQDFEGITFNSETIKYDGKEHTITAKGVPDFATATYKDNGPFTDVGTYPMSVTVTATGYNPLTLSATLTITGQDFTGVTFNDETITFDGKKHTIEVKGTIPEGTNIEYKDNGPFTDVGTYPMKATLSKAGYNTKTLTATLTIETASFDNLEFKSKIVDYDGKPHKIEVVGIPPEVGAKVTYTSDVAGIKNEATEMGTYNITAKVEAAGFKTETLFAKLIINTNDEKRNLCWSKDGNTLFFQNALHNDYLYSYNPNATPKINKISTDKAIDMVQYGNSEILFVGDALVAPAIKKTNNEKTDNIKFGFASYLQYDGNNTVYYVVNGLTKQQSGIYKLDISTEDSNPILLSEGKARYLQLVNSNLYFADGNNDNYLSKINLSTPSTRTKVCEDKIKNLSYLDGSLYYTANETLGDYIVRYNLSSSTRTKLCSSAGFDFYLYNDYLYFINDDFNTYIFGDGIYKVSINSKLPDLPGTKVIGASKYGFSSMHGKGSNLYYYDLDGYKLIESSLDGKKQVNLLNGFVKPDDPAPIGELNHLEVHNDILYFNDPIDGKNLHTYNLNSKSNYQITSNKVADFNFVGDDIYMNVVSTFVNNDIYRANPSGGTEPVKISGDDGKDFVSDGEYLYYIRCNVSGAATAITKCDLDGQNSEDIYSKGVSNLRINGKKLLFIDSDQIFSLDLDNEYTVTEIKPDGKSAHTTCFETDGTNIFYREMFGLLDKALSRCKLDGSEYLRIDDDLDPVTIIANDGVVYCYSEVSNMTNTGLYKVNATVTQATTATPILKWQNKYYSKSFVVHENNIYFTNHSTKVLGDGYTYQISTSGGTPTRIN